MFENFFFFRTAPESCHFDRPCQLFSTNTHFNHFQSYYEKIMLIFWQHEEMEQELKSGIWWLTLTSQLIAALNSISLSAHFSFYCWGLLGTFVIKGPI